MGTWQIVVLFATLTVTSGQILDVICPVDQNFFFPHGTSCTVYFECNGGDLYQHTCDSGLHFNPTTGACDAVENVNCTWGQQLSSEELDGECEGQGFFPHPSSCSRFIECHNGVGKIHNCVVGFYFNGETGVCDLPDNVDCILDGGEEETDDTEIGGGGGSQTEETETITETTESDNEETESTTEITESDDEETESTTETTESDNEENDLGIVCTPDKKYSLPHPTSCQKYIECVYGEMTISSCYSGFYWNPATNNCDLAENVDCHIHETTVADTAITDTITTDTTLTDPTTTDATIPETTVADIVTTITDTITEVTTDYDTEDDSTSSGDGEVIEGTTQYPIEEETDSPIEEITEQPTDQTTEGSTEMEGETPDEESDLGIICSPDTKYSLPHPTSCQKYIECVYGEMTISSCYSGFYWNPVTNNCDLAQNVDCHIHETTVTDTTITVTITTDTTLTDPTTTDAAITETTVADIVTTITDTITEVTTDYDIEDDSTSSGDGEMIEGTTQYPTEEETDSNIDEATEQPTDQTTEGSTEMEGETPDEETDLGIICSPDKKYSLPHPTSCQKYIECVYGEMTISSCYSGFYWNPVTNNCDLAQNVDCHIHETTVADTTITDTITADTTLTDPTTTDTTITETTVADIVTTITDTITEVTTDYDIEDVSTSSGDGEVTEGTTLYPTEEETDSPIDETTEQPTDQTTEGSTEMEGGTPDEETDLGIICSPDTKYSLPHPTSCQKYIECVYGEMTISSCYSGFYWNPATNNCDLAENVDCHLDGTTVTDATVTDTSLPDTPTTEITVTSTTTTDTPVPDTTITDIVTESTVTDTTTTDTTLPDTTTTDITVTETTVSDTTITETVTDTTVTETTVPDTTVTETIVTDTSVTDTTVTDTTVSDTTITETTVTDTSVTDTTLTDITNAPTELPENTTEIDTTTENTTENQTEETTSENSTTTENPTEQETEESITEGSEETQGNPNGICNPVNGQYVQFLTDKYHCDRFYKCDWGIPILTFCPEGLHFNPNLNVCDWPANAGCTVQSTGPTEVTEQTTLETTTPTTQATPEDGPDGICNSTNGIHVQYLPDKLHCDRFYKCNWGTPVLFYCPDGLHFNPSINVCDWPWNAGCRTA